MKSAKKVITTAVMLLVVGGVLVGSGIAMKGGISEVRAYAMDSVSTTFSGRQVNCKEYDREHFDEKYDNFDNSNPRFNRGRCRSRH